MLVIERLRRYSCQQLNIQLPRRISIRIFRTELKFRESSVEPDVTHAPVIKEFFPFHIGQHLFLFLLGVTRFRHALATFRIVFHDDVNASASTHRIDDVELRGFQALAVPEPSSLMAIALVGGIVVLRRRR